VINAKKQQNRNPLLFKNKSPPFVHIIEIMTKNPILQKVSKQELFYIFRIQNEVPNFKLK
jgi:hypothetical protein